MFLLHPLFSFPTICSFLCTLNSTPFLSHLFLIATFFPFPHLQITFVFTACTSHNWRRANKRCNCKGIEDLSFFSLSSRVSSLLISPPVEAPFPFAPFAAFAPFVSFASVCSVPSFSLFSPFPFCSPFPFRAAAAFATSFLSFSSKDQLYSPFLFIVINNN
jgi:hypothetical protein